MPAPADTTYDAIAARTRAARRVREFHLIMVGVLAFGAVEVT
jgi:hypothetical protein